MVKPLKTCNALQVIYTPAQSNWENQMVKESCFPRMDQSMPDAGNRDSTMDKEGLLLKMEH